jgi:hypothetical protein
MLGSDKSRGYCLEMICADFLAGAHLDDGNPEILLNSISRYYKFLLTPREKRDGLRTFTSCVSRTGVTSRRGFDSLLSGISQQEAKTEPHNRSQRPGLLAVPTRLS